MKKLLIILGLLLVTVFSYSQQNIRGYKIEAFELLQTHDAFVISNDTMYNTTQLSDIDTTFVTKLWAIDSLVALTMPLDTVLFSTEYVISGDEAVGTIFWDIQNETVSIVLEGGVIGQVFEEAFITGQNDTGGTLSNGKVATYEGSIGNSGNMRIELTVASSDEPPYMTLGIITQDIINGDIGKITTRGKVRDIQTDGANYGETWVDKDILYKSSTYAGGLTNVEPNAPTPATPIAIVISAHATNGTLFARPTFPHSLEDLSDVDGEPLVKTGQFPVYNSTNEYFDFNYNIENYLFRSAWNGTFQESFNAVVTSNGITITMSLQSKTSGDLMMQFSDTLQILDCTPVQTIALTAGTATSPQSNYIYILQSTKALTQSSTGWSTDEHIKVGYFYVQDAVSVQGHGALINQNWNDELSGSNNTGHITHIGQWIRSKGANWFSGCDGGGTSGYITPYAGGGTFQVNAGVIMQMHQHNYASKNTATGDTAHCANYPSESFKTVTDLNQMLVDANGVSLTNRYYNLIIAGVANKGGEYSPLMLKLPQGSYNSSFNAIDDVDGYDNYEMPREFNKESSTGFLIARITIRNQGDATFTVMNTQDLRGLIGATASGATGGTTLTNYADNQFTIYNNTDATKIFNFDASGITTGNTRTFNVPDYDINFGGLVIDGSDSLVNGNTVYDYIVPITDSLAVHRTDINQNASDIVTLQSSSHPAVTIGTANGLSLSTQELSLAAATNSTPGAATAAQITKLEGIEALADVTDATNVTAAGAAMAGGDFHDGFSDFVLGEHFLQSAISISASQISDFDTEVSNNVSVLANTGKDTTGIYHANRTALDLVSGTNTGDNAANTNYANDYRAANFIAGTDYEVPLTFSTGLTRTTNTITTNDSEINHNSLLNYNINQHRIINDAATSTTELWSASKINSELGTITTNYVPYTGATGDVDFGANDISINNASFDDRLTISSNSGSMNGITLNDSGDNPAAIFGTNPSTGEVRIGAIRATGSYFTTIYSGNIQSLGFDTSGNATFSNKVTANAVDANLTSGFIPYDNAGVLDDGPIQTNGTNIALGTTAAGSWAVLIQNQFAFQAKSSAGTSKYEMYTDINQFRLLNSMALVGYNQDLDLTVSSPLTYDVNINTDLNVDGIVAHDDATTAGQSLAKGQMEDASMDVDVNSLEINGVPVTNSYISNVTESSNNITFTGIGSAFNSSIGSIAKTDISNIFTASQTIRDAGVSLNITSTTTALPAINFKISTTTDVGSITGASDGLFMTGDVITLSQGGATPREFEIKADGIFGTLDAKSTETNVVYYNTSTKEWTYGTGATPAYGASAEMPYMNGAGTDFDYGGIEFDGVGINLSAAAEVSRIVFNSGIGTYDTWTMQNFTSNKFTLYDNDSGNFIWTGNADGSFQLNDYGSGNNTGTSAYNLEVDASGNVIETTAGSDFRLKENFRTLNNSLDKILNINTYAFDWKKDIPIKAVDTEFNIRVSDDFEERESAGVIAQEIIDIIPESVKQYNNGYYRVDYEVIIPYLIEAIKEQQKQINELKNKIK